MANEYGNYNTFNPLDRHASTTLASGNLHANGTTTHEAQIRSTLPLTGKTYWEVEADTLNSDAAFIGILKINTDIMTMNNHSLGTTADGYSINCSTGSNNGKLFNNNTSGTDLGTISNGDIISVAYDADSRKLFFGKGGSWLGSADPANGTNPAYTASAGTYTAAVGVYTTSSLFKANFGQTAFAYTVPTGFNPINTANMSAPAIINPDDHFFSTVVDHDGSSTATTCSFNLDTYEWLAIIKNTTGSGEKWYIINSLNGANKYHTWQSAVQATDANVMTVSGTTLTLGSTLGDKDYLVEVHKAGLSSAKAANEEGATNTIATTVNLTSGFGMSEFTGTGSNTTVGHGLDIAPALTIPNNNTIADGHYVLHTGGSDPDERLNIGATSAEATDAANFNGSYPSATVISLGTADRTNKSGSNIVLYYWHSVAGYSAFGSYEGNGAADGAFIHTSFSVNSWFHRNIDATENWIVKHKFDGDGANSNNHRLYYDQTAAQDTATSSELDMVSNGIKHRNANAQGNSAATFIYGAWGGRPIQADGGVNQGRAK